MLTGLNFYGFSTDAFSIILAPRNVVTDRGLLIQSIFLWQGSEGDKHVFSPKDNMQHIIILFHKICTGADPENFWGGGGGGGPILT